jgi:pimeloyl-ACP methyl ester carboxylesterase
MHLTRRLIFAVLVMACSTGMADHAVHWLPAEGSGYPANTFLSTEHLGTKLYLSDKPGKRPLVLLLHGSEGGTGFMEDFGVQETLRARGFHVLGAIYFDSSSSFPGPKALNQVRLESFMEEIKKYAQAHHEIIDSSEIGIVGVSLGGELSLLLASLYPEFKFVLALVPGDVVFQKHDPFGGSPWMHKDKELPYVRFPILAWQSIKCFVMWNGFWISQYSPFEFLRWAPERMLCTGMMLDAMERADNLEQASIKVENINGPVLLVSGQDDIMWPSAFMSDRALERLKKNNFTHPKGHLALPGGHGAWTEIWFQTLDILSAMLESEKNGDQTYREKANEILARHLTKPDSQKHDS